MPLCHRYSRSQDMTNFRPVPIVTFMSKVVERVVARGMNDYLAEHHLLPRLQSAYRRQHSTETALLYVMSDALTTADDRQVTLIGLLDMSAAFDCVDHSILLQRLERNFGITDLAYQWVTSYITGRTQQVLYNGKLSQLQQLSYGVPQGQCLACCSSICTQQTSVKLSSFMVMTTAKSIAACL